MLPAAFSSLLSRDCELQPCRAMRQVWRTERWHKYLVHPRPDYGLILVLQGKMEYIWDSGSLALTAGDLAFLPKGSHYDACMYTELGCVQTLLVNFDFPAMEDVQPPQLLCSNAAAQFESLMTDTVRAYENRADGQYLLKSQLYLLLHHVLLLVQTQSDPQAETMEQAKHLLVQAPGLSVGQVARQCCVSERSLRRLFRQRLGMSPVAYRNSVKLQEACRLLISTDMPVGEVAAALGYYDEAYFCKCFLQNMGDTPTRYRHKNRSVP